MDEQLTFDFQPAKRPSIKGFPELRWTGKRPYTSTQYYPAQLRERYGDEQNEDVYKRQGQSIHCLHKKSAKIKKECVL